MKLLPGSESFSNRSSKLLPRKAVMETAWIGACGACAVLGTAAGSWLGTGLAGGWGWCGASSSWE